MIMIVEIGHYKLLGEGCFFLGYLLAYVGAINLVTECCNIECYYITIY